jgi:hypothetical protein
MHHNALPDTPTVAPDPAKRRTVQRVFAPSNRANDELAPSERLESLRDQKRLQVAAQICFCVSIQGFEHIYPRAGG